MQESKTTPEAFHAEHCPNDWHGRHHPDCPYGKPHTTERQPDSRILKHIKKRHKEFFEYPSSEGTVKVYHHTRLEELYKLRGLEHREIWDALSRLVVSGKIVATGSNRCKSYAPVEAA